MVSKQARIRPLSLLCMVLLSTIAGVSAGQTVAGTGEAKQDQTTAMPPVYAGPYLGTKPADDQPLLFAPGVVCTGLGERDVAMTPDGKEIYFSVVVGNYALSTIMVSREVDGRWTEPVVAPFMEDPRYMNLEPAISPDGKKFLFLSNRPNPARGEKTIGSEDIWVMDWTATGWGQPYNLGEPVNTEHAEFFPSLTKDGTLYFTRAEKGSRVNKIFRSKLKDGRYSAPELLPPQVNSGTSQFNAFVAPDESYLIVPVDGRKDSVGGTDYYIVFRSADDTWSEPVNLGKEVNTAGSLESSPYVSPDGAFFFFMSSRSNLLAKLAGNFTAKAFRDAFSQPGNGNSDIYWMSAAFLEKLRPVKGGNQ